jgi:phosphohistidine swiveling domain-containing protein
MFHHAHHVSWQRINFRSSDCLLTAEFLHGLYSRHDPFLNPFRFANTIVVFRPWESESWAPTEEWERLGRRFGDRFLRNPGRTAADLRHLLASPRTRARELAAELARRPPGQCDDDELIDLLIRLQHVPLGDIYEVNLVQVEHALHAAVGALVADRDGSERAHEIVAALATTDTPTVAAQADADFLRVASARRLGDIGPEAAREALDVIARRHEELGSAYGAATVSIEGLALRLERYLALDNVTFAEALAAGSHTAVPAPAPLAAPHHDLIPLLRLTGEVRDRNKALLGTVTRHRSALVHEVSRRTGVGLDALRLYLLEEIIRLVEDGAEVPAAILDGRSRDGLALRREEGFFPATQAPAGVCGTTPGILPDVLTGLCASAGVYEGTVRVVSSAEDLGRMSVGDVLVARGTDFDLILLLRMAGAIVTEEGGMLSHAAVVARELSVPCLIRVAGATSALVDGERVTVDAGAGHVTRRTATPRSVTVRASVAQGAGRLVLRVEELDDAREAGRKALGLHRLRALELPTPDFRVVPTSVCDNAAGEGETAAGLRRAVAEAIVATYLGRRISVRSSSTLEDLDDGTAAGVYHSEVDIAPDTDAVEAAVGRVLGSRWADRARAYHDLAGRDHRAPMALLVAPYEEFIHQGVAVSHCPNGSGAALVEARESDGTGGCPDGAGELWEFAHSRLRSRRGGPYRPTIPYLTSDLRDLAARTLELADQLGGPVEVEWGRNSTRVLFLQARLLHVAEKA